MTPTVAEPSAKPSGVRWPMDAPMAGLIFVLIVTGYMRLTIGAHRPLWLDEAQTGMLLIQPTLADFIRQCTYDINAPLYYVLARVWALFSGVSDQALRALPCALSLVAPLIALVPRRLISRQTRLTWCALLACWVPGIIFSQEARWYTLAFALAVANTVAFIAVLKDPRPRNAWVWTIVSSLLILAHYYGAILLAFQGFTYLFVHKRRAFATWPAALAFIPAFAAIAVHASRLIMFTAPGTSWIPLMRPEDLFWKSGFIFGSVLLIYVAALWLMFALGVRLFAGSLRDMFRIDNSDQVWTASACALAATALVAGLGFLAPVFVDRYLTEFVPALLLGLAKFAETFDRRAKFSGGILVSLFFAFTALWAAWMQPFRSIHDYNYETASGALMATKPDRLVFLWDNPMRPEPSQLAALGGFFFARAGFKTPVDPVVLAADEDPNQILLARAAQPGSAILWISDRGVRGTASIRHPPVIAKLDPAWACHNFGNWQYRIIACSRDPAWRARFRAQPSAPAPANPA